MPSVVTTSAPPPTLMRSLAHLGPGIVLASSIVGSGELIGTTTVGAEAGFALLWLIVLGCVIKVAAQVEIGRNTLAWGRTPLDAFDRVPGPRLAGRGWLWWGWAAMTVLILVQQAGILAGVAQTLAGGLPLTAAGRGWNTVHDEAAALRVAAATAERRGNAAEAERARERLGELVAAEAGLAKPADEAVWIVVTGLGTAALLVVGRYAAIEAISVILVGTFTLVTVVALAMLQFDPAWAVSLRDVAGGLVPAVPPSTGGRSPLATGLATFGIIGVGASELMVYPYWCLEKGYGRAVGDRGGPAGRHDPRPGGDGAGQRRGAGHDARRTRRGRAVVPLRRDGAATQALARMGRPALGVDGGIHRRRAVDRVAAPRRCRGVTVSGPQACARRARADCVIARMAGWASRLSTEIAKNCSRTCSSRPTTAT